MSEGEEKVETNEERIKEVMRKRSKAQREAHKQHEEKKREKAPKVSRLEQRREANRLAAERAEAGFEDEEEYDHNSDGAEDKKKGQKKSKKEKEETKKKTTLMGSPAVKAVCLVALVPIVVCVPFAVARLCALLERLPGFVLPAVWAVYAVAVAAVLLGLKRHKATWDSVLTHNCVYAIFSFGAYYFMHVADNVPLRYRRRSLLVWNTVTMLLNIVMMVVDDTDYQQQARDEREKARRREERRKRREEQQKQKQKEQEEDKEQEEKEQPWYKRNRVVRVAMDALVYVGFAVLVYLVARSLREYKRAFDQRIEEGRAPNEERTWGYEGRTGADWKPDVHDDDLDSAHVGATTAPSDEEWHPTIRDEDLE